ARLQQKRLVVPGHDGLHLSAALAFEREPDHVGTVGDPGTMAVVDVDDRYARRACTLEGVAEPVGATSERGKQTLPFVVLEVVQDVDGDEDVTHGCGPPSRRRPSRIPVSQGSVEV